MVTYGLVSYRDVNMQERIGQTVNITGWVIKRRENSVKRGNPEPKWLTNISNLVKRVSPSCS